MGQEDAIDRKRLNVFDVLASFFIFTYENSIYPLTSIGKRNWINLIDGEKQATTGLKKPHRQNRDLGNKQV